MTHTTQIAFCTLDGTAATGSFTIAPVTVPKINSASLAVGCPIASNTSTSSFTLVDNVYRIEKNTTTASNCWYANLASTASLASQITSGSYTTASLVSVVFNLQESNLTAESTRVTLRPCQKNIGWNGKFVVSDKLAYTTNGSGSFTTSIIPGFVYDVFSTGHLKSTNFKIKPQIGVATQSAAEILVIDDDAATVITPQNQSEFAYTADASDLRYLRTDGGNITASYVLASNVHGIVPSASVALLAATASYFNGTVASASRATTSSYAFNALSASYAATSSNAITASYLRSGQDVLGVNTVEVTTLSYGDPNYIQCTGAYTLINIEEAGQYYIGQRPAGLGWHCVDEQKFFGDLVGNADTATRATDANSADFVYGGNVDGFVANADFATSALFADEAGTADNAAVLGNAVNLQIVYDGLGQRWFAKKPLSSSAFSGSLYGTASWATNTLTASYFGGTVATSSYTLLAATASYVASASYALSSSNATTAATATTASYSLNGITSSYALTAATASYVLNGTSASYALLAATASYYGGSVASASYATTASYALLAASSLTSSFSYNSGSMVVTSDTNTLITTKTLSGRAGLPILIIPGSSNTAGGDATLSGGINTSGTGGNAIVQGGVGIGGAGGDVNISAGSGTTQGKIVLKDSTGIGRVTVSSSLVTVSGSLAVTNGVTGSLAGTASYALSAITASYYGGSVDSSSYAQTTDGTRTNVFTINADTGHGKPDIYFTSDSNNLTITAAADGVNFVLDTVGGVFVGGLQGNVAGTSSWATHAITSSYYGGSVTSASYAANASVATSATTASFYYASVGTAASAATITANFTGSPYIKLSPTGSIAFSSSNRPSGVAKTINYVLTGDSSNRSLSFEPGWNWFVAAPTILTANKKGWLTLTAIGTAATDVYAAYKESI